MLKDKGGAVPIVMLVVVAVLATGVLGATNFVTKDKIDEQLQRIAAENRMLIFPEASGFTELEIENPEANSDINSVYTAEDEGSQIGYVIEASGKGYGGDLPVMVGLTNDGSVTGVRVLSNSETPGLGTKIEDENFLNLFTGTDATGLYSTKQMDEGDTEIAAVTGATISSKAVVEAVNNASSYANGVLDVSEGGEL